MNKDEVKGKMKDIAGRVERQTGEWTGDTEAQVHGAAKQAEGKIQNAWGEAKDAAKKTNEPDKKVRPATDEPQEREEDTDIHLRRKAS